MADVTALVAEVKAALHNGSGIPIPNPEARWLGALVQAVEDQQREINCEVFVACDGQKRRINGGHIFKFDGGPCDLCHPSSEVAQLRADGQRLQARLQLPTEVMEAAAIDAFHASRAVRTPANRGTDWLPHDVIAAIRAACQAALAPGDARELEQVRGRRDNEGSGGALLANSANKPQHVAPEWLPQATAASESSAVSRDVLRHFLGVALKELAYRTEHERVVVAADTEAIVNLRAEVARLRADGQRFTEALDTIYKIAAEGDVRRTAFEALHPSVPPGNAP